MPISRDELQAKRHVSDQESAVYWLRRAVGQIDLFEEVTGLARSNPDMRLVDRLARLGCSKTACDELEALLNAIDNRGALAPDIQRLLAECEAAEHFANGQPAVFVERAA
jgi:hypothetical protein